MQSSMCIKLEFSFENLFTPTIHIHELKFLQSLFNVRFVTGAAQPQKKRRGLGGYNFLVNVFIAFLGDLEK